LTVCSYILAQQGSSQARYFVSRLIPAHKDPTYEQVFSSCEPYNLVHLNSPHLCGLNGNGLSCCSPVCWQMNFCVFQESRFPQLRTLTP